MPRPREEFEDLRPFEFREPEEVLEEEYLYTVYEIARLLQGVDPDREMDAETEAILLDWAVPWMLDNSEAFVFAEPDADEEPGYYGLR
jgi:hypothetical protein